MPGTLDVDVDVVDEAGGRDEQAGALRRFFEGLVGRGPA
jgi:hypothetical protein